MIGATGCSDTDSDVPAPATADNRPIPEITIPGDGAIFSSGNSVQFIGNCLDPEDGVLEGIAVMWDSNLDGDIGNGLSFSSDTLSEGTHTITLTCTDSQGNTGTNIITITIAAPAGDAPTAEITSPADGSFFFNGDIVRLTGTGADAEGNELTDAALAWTSDIDGELCTGADCGTNTLRIGTHTIILTCTDAAGISGTDTVTITIKRYTDAPPTATIGAPADGAVFSQGESIRFTGSATDPEEGLLTGDALVWTSDIDEIIGTGGSITIDSLRVGNHQITLTGIDANGDIGEMTVRITVIAQTESPRDVTVPVTGQTTF